VTSQWKPPDLTGKVAVVTGASRGVGRGIAIALGEAGAKVYVTARSVRGRKTTEGLPGTLEDTVEEITKRGGTAVPLRCDHTVDADAEEVFHQVSTMDGRLDVLVNNAWAGYQRGSEARFDAPFWQQPLWRWDLFSGSLRGQFVASRLAVPLMLNRGVGLIVNVSFTDGDTYLGQVAYDVSKSASDRMALGMAYELRKYDIAAVALHPGFVRTERVEAAWEFLGSGPAQVVHSPEYVGRAVAHPAPTPRSWPTRVNAWPWATSRPAMGSPTWTGGSRPLSSSKAASPWPPGWKGSTGWWPRARELADHDPARLSGRLVRGDPAAL
jgi:NAD(P)-dependent dehydrogenase (short-subunit alcohol dehydrogenase family)